MTQRERALLAFVLESVSGQLSAFLPADVRAAVAELVGSLRAPVKGKQ